MTHLFWEKRITLGTNTEMFRPLLWADYGVDLFFILSGFIMHWVYVAGNEEGFSWKVFFKARAARILPLYYLTLLPALPPVIRTLRVHGLMHDGGKTSLMLAGNLTMVVGLNGEAGWVWRYNPANWSVSVECVAYVLLMPLLVGIHMKFREKSTWPILICGWIGLILAHQQASHPLLGWDWSQVGRGMTGFCLGFALCAVFLKKERKRYRSFSVLLPIVLGVILCAIYGQAPRIWALFLMPVLVFLTASDDKISRLLFGNPLLEWMGERSYSIYLWHTPVMFIWLLPLFPRIDSKIGFSKQLQGSINIILLISVVMLVSEISYRFFERPVRAWIRKIWIYP